MTPELARVRLSSWAGALVLAALIGFALTRPFAARFASPGEQGPGAISVSIEAPEPERQQTPQRPRFEYLGEAAQSAGAAAPGAEGVRLWRYGARGEIIFASAEQFQRCLTARRNRADAPDCPSADEPAALAWEHNRDRQGFVRDAAASLRRY
jgi:hypothetical protein